MVDNEELNRFGEWFEKEDRKIQKEWKLSPCRECLFSSKTREEIENKCKTCEYKKYLKKKNEKETQEGIWLEVLRNRVGKAKK